MNLGILLPLGGSLETLEKHGQKSRFINYYLSAYKKNFKKVFVFQYPKFPHRYLYTFLLPFLNYRKISQCNVLRVMQLTGIIPAIISKILFKKHFIVTYGYDYQKSAQIEGKKILIPFLKILEKIGLKFANEVFVTSKAIKLKLKKKYPQLEITLLPNGVDTKTFKPKLKTFNPKNINILFVGRLEKQKNLENLIHAISYSKLKDKITLTLIGRGSQEQKLKRLTQKKSIKTKFITRLPHHKMPKEYQKADIFTLVSMIEGQPKAIIEALSCGLPVIASNIPALREIIAHRKNGLLTDTSPKKIAESIGHLVKNEHMRKRLTQNARKTAINKFDIKKILKQEASLLEKHCS